jgi:hypothetical protein
MVTPLATLSVVAADNAALPESVRTPVFKPSPNPNAPLKVSAFPTVRAVTLSLAIFPPLNTTVPVPNAAPSPTNTLPALNVAPPLNVFVPLNVSVPLPFFTNRPLPLITPLYTVSDDPLNVSTFPCKFTNPAPANVAISSLLANFNVPPPFTVTAVLLSNALPPLNVSVPAFTAVAPLNVFVPESVNSATPVFVKS